MTKDSEVWGLFIPSEDKLFVIKETRWTDKNRSLDRLRKMLTARGLVDFAGLHVGKDKAKVIPRIMNLTEAKQKGYEIVELPASEMEAKRTIVQDTVAEKPAKGFFKKQ